MIFCFLLQEPFYQKKNKNKNWQNLLDGLTNTKYSVCCSYLPDAFSQDLKDSLVIADILN